MSAFMRIAVAAIVIAIVGRVGIMALTPSPTGTSPLDTSSWTTYTSERYGFSIGHPADWTERPAAHTWAYPADIDWLSLGSEGFHAPGQSILVTAWSVPIDAGFTSGDQWIADYCQRNTSPCDALGDRLTPVSIDGHPGNIRRFLDDTQAFTQVGNRMYVVAVWEPDSDPRTSAYGGAVSLLQGFMSTMHLLPEGPGLDTSSWHLYTSNRYGFTIGHPPDWTEQPADHNWTMADATVFPSPATEHFLSPDSQVGVSVWSVVDPASGQDRAPMTWIQGYCQVAESDSPCSNLTDQILPATVDGHQGALVKFVQDTQAFFLVGDRMYVAAVWRNDSDPSTVPYGGAVRLLRAFVSTMHLLPGGPVPSSASSSSTSSPSPS